ncbi:MAG TPA: metallophosphoesterase [Fluviicoccus sp.]|nr:metallophosphoesterase [Fluviicoccus sp.]
MTIVELKPYMAITYGFTRAIVAQALAKQAGTKQATPAMYSRAGRLIFQGKAEGLIKPHRQRGHYYHFTENADTTQAEAEKPKGPVLRVARNTRGRDLIVGDIHGCFTKLEARLKEVGFDPEAGDRLFSVGDLVDRGPECDQALIWLQKPWFFAVAGNHEDMAIRWPKGNMNSGNYAANGGAWNIMKSIDESLEFADAFADLPVALELETKAGLVGIVHAHCPFESWQEFTAALEDPNLSNNRRDRIISAAQWDRSRIAYHPDGPMLNPVEGVRAVVVGHTPLTEPTWCANVLHIDTAGWHPSGAGFTVIDADTLCVAETKEAHESTS